MNSRNNPSESKKRKRNDDAIEEDFEKLAQKYPNFRQQWHAVRAKQQQTGGSFSSVVTQEFNIELTRALMDSRFGVSLPSLPSDRLCPPVPNRFAYVQWLKNDLLPLLCETNDYFTSMETLKYRGIDIGTGSSCIYPILFTSNNNEWKMIATEIDAYSVESARANVKANQLQDRIQIHLVKPTLAQQKGSERGGSDATSSGGPSSGGPIVRALECCNDSSFDFVMVNPPFFDTAASMEPRADNRDRTPMTCYEGSYPGGEVGFLCDMIRDSLLSRERIGWYSAMCGKKSSFTRLTQILVHLLGPGHVQSMEYSPGYMTRWFLAWTFQRPKIKSPAAKLSGGIDHFEVRIDSKQDDANPLDEVVSRIQTYLETFPGWKLSSTVRRTDHGTIVTAVEASPAPLELSSQVDDAESLPDRIFDGIDCSWDANKFLPVDGHFLVEVTVTNCTDRRSFVSVRLDCYRHSNRGAKAVEKIRSQLQGEVCRSNRKWRRILKRQANETQTS